MAVIAGLYFYPVKGCRGIAVEQAPVEETGLQHDRHWMVVGPDGRFVTQRELPGMALISTAIDEASLTLSAHDAPLLHVPFTFAGRRGPVTVWRDRCCGLDAGDAASDWLSAVLGRDLRLVRFDPSTRRRSDPSTPASTTPTPNSPMDSRCS